MSRNTEELHGITLLGNQKTEYRSDYAPEVLEAFDNKHQGNNYFVKFVCPEFTSLCPMTGQPDFATIVMLKPPKMRREKKRKVRRRNEGTRQSARHRAGDVPVPAPPY